MVWNDINILPVVHLPKRFKGSDVLEQHSVCATIGCCKRHGYTSFGIPRRALMQIYGAKRRTLVATCLLRGHALLDAKAELPLSGLPQLLLTQRVLSDAVPWNGTVIADRTAERKAAKRPTSVSGTRAKRRLYCPERCCFGPERRFVVGS